MSLIQWRSLYIHVYSALFCLLLTSVDGEVFARTRNVYNMKISHVVNTLNTNQLSRWDVPHHSIERDAVAWQQNTQRDIGDLLNKEYTSTSREFTDKTLLGNSKFRRTSSILNQRTFLKDRRLRFLEESHSSRDGLAGEFDNTKRVRNKRQTDVFEYYRMKYDDDADAALGFIKYLDEHNENCTRVKLSFLNIYTANATYSGFANQAKTAVKTSNLLNTFYQTIHHNVVDSSFLTNSAVYFSLVRNNVESDVNIFGSCVAFDSYQYNDTLELFAPYAYRGDKGTVFTKDLAVLNYTAPDTESMDWFTYHRANPPVVYNMHEKFGYHLPRHNETHFDKQLNLTHIFIEESEGSWSSPYFDCGGGNSWMLTYSVPFYGTNYEFRGVVSVDIDLQTIDINQCANDTSMFSGTHKCKNTTECVPISSQGFRGGSYQCVCKDNYYFPVTNSPNRSYNGTTLEDEYHRKIFGFPNNYDDGFECLPCPKGCDGCVDDTPCFVEENLILRSILLGVELLCMFVVVILMLVIFKFRRVKVISHDSPYMLEIVLFGALLLYSAVVARYWAPNTLVCLLVRWLREWGFAVAYGMLILKTYRILAIFQTRSATRVLVRDRDLLKWLCLILFILSGYLAAWTAYSLDEINRCGRDMLEIGVVETVGLKYYVCRSDWWDIAIEAAEFLFLIFGIYLCYLVRSAPTDFHETRYISIAIYNETIFSLFLHVSRQFVWYMAGPEWIYLMYVIRSQLTTTVMVALIFIPKLVRVFKMKSSGHFRERAYSEGLSLESKLRSAANSGNSFNDPDLNQEDVKEELKRLYTQLEIYKTKTMKIDNPHIPKKKGGLGARWKTARKFSRRFSRSLQAPGQDSDRERSSEIARSTESLARPLEMDDVRHHHEDHRDSDHRIIGNSTKHVANQRWMCQQ
ncbi:metabotropic glycine receptor-like [Saccoglossus kowalevskii]|uniref:Probable G-protein coupled receptor 158-like n=1 Tax=Saccoglossus kowalevskii TaxID=10224 RepID=A0ABM0MJF3_SACKO|nr:PREDICTED: probable G-protein coupled receptor 158-like [Saccoglossus kowalevskii]